MPTYQGTECAYDVDEGWFDRTRYAYADDDVRVIAEPFAPLAEAKSRVDDAIGRFSLSMARYQLIERRAVERPFRGEIVTHRFGGRDLGVSGQRPQPHRGPLPPRLRVLHRDVSTRGADMSDLPPRPIRRRTRPRSTAGSRRSTSTARA
jgi:hypothetical protein